MNQIENKFYIPPGNPSLKFEIQAGGGLAGGGLAGAAFTGGLFRDGCLNADVLLVGLCEVGALMEGDWRGGLSKSIDCRGVFGA